MTKLCGCIDFIHLERPNINYSMILLRQIVENVELL